LTSVDESVNVSTLIDTKEVRDAAAGSVPRRLLPGGLLLGLALLLTPCEQGRDALPSFRLPGAVVADAAETHPPAGRARYLIAALPSAQDRGLLSGP
jgi:hypothetical protein